MDHLSLDTAKKLKEAGFPQEGEGFYYRKHLSSGVTFDPKYYDETPLDDKNEFIKARLAEEILERLPPTITYNNYNCLLYINPIENKWSCYYSSFNGKEGMRVNPEKNLCEVLAQMWLLWNARKPEGK